MRHRVQEIKMIRWSNEDKCYIGTCPSLFYGGVHGSDELKVYQELCRVVAEWGRYDRRGLLKSKRSRRFRS